MLLGKGCELGARNACFNLSILYLQGQRNPDFAVDKSKACQLAEQACRLGHSWGCANASRMHRVGDGVPVDETKADELKKLALEIEALSRNL